MMKVAAVSYRDWALEIYDRLSKETDDEFLIIRSKEEFSFEELEGFEPDLVLFYGWSWIIPEPFLNRFQCIMLHPSPLPKYRGGSPIQNQIINGEVESAVTLFLMDQGMDTGPILAQKGFSLEGNLSDVFRRITDVGVELTKKILIEGLEPVDQDHSVATVWKRRTPSESEITLEELTSKPARYLHNKIRMLQDPYPNAFIRTSCGQKLYLVESRLEEEG